MKTFEYTDKGNCERFQEHWNSRVRFIEQQKQWIVHTKNGWKYAQRFKLTGPVVRNIHKEVEGKDTETRKAILTHAKWSESTTAQRSMLAQAQDFMAVSLLDFDSNPYLINCKNTVLDLSNKEIKPVNHSPTQLHLKRVNAVYDPKAQCPRWVQFLYEIFDGDTELIRYLQIMFGYSMMGLTREHLFFLCYGNGRNGKGVLLETVGHVLGDYAKLSMDFETFLEKDKKSARLKEAVANLRGIRYAVASETSNSARLNSALVKRLTGDDTLEGARLYGDTFEFKPTHKLWFACNHLPGNMDASLAMTERVKVVPFKKNFLEEDQRTEKALKECLAEQETNGIFTWLVNGAHEYNLHGRPETPVAIKQATEDYLDSFDRLRVFIREHLEKDNRTLTTGKEIYELYCEWCDDNDEFPISDKKFYINLNERGVRCERKEGGQTLIGWKLREKS